MLYHERGGKGGREGEGEGEKKWWMDEHSIVSIKVPYMYAVFFVKFFLKPLRNDTTRNKESDLASWGVLILEGSTNIRNV